MQIYNGFGKKFVATNDYNPEIDSPNRDSYEVDTEDVI